MSCYSSSILLADNQYVVYRLVYRLKMLYIVEFYQEGETFVFVQISESRLPCHCKTVGECLYAYSQKWYLVLIHKSDYMMSAYLSAAKLQIISEINWILPKKHLG